MSRKEVSILGRGAGLGPTPQAALLSPVLPSKGTGVGGSGNRMPQGVADNTEGALEESGACP